MNWQGSSSDASKASVPIDTVKVPLMYHWTVDCEMIVNRRRRVLSTCLPATLNTAKENYEHIEDFVCNLTVLLGGKECYRGVDGSNRGAVHSSSSKHTTTCIQIHSGSLAHTTDL